MPAGYYHINNPELCFMLVIFSIFFVPWNKSLMRPEIPYSDRHYERQQFDSFRVNSNSSTEQLSYMLFLCRVFCGARMNLVVNRSRRLIRRNWLKSFADP